MGVAFGLLVLGLILHAVFVGEMLAHGMVGPLVILAQWLVGGGAPSARPLIYPIR